MNDSKKNESGNTKGQNLNSEKEDQMKSPQNNAQGHTNRTFKQLSIKLIEKYSWQVLAVLGGIFFGFIVAVGLLLKFPYNLLPLVALLGTMIIWIRNPASWLRLMAATSLGAAFTSDLPYFVINIIKPYLPNLTYSFIEPDEIKRTTFIGLCIFFAIVDTFNRRMDDLSEKSLVKLLLRSSKIVGLSIVVVGICFIFWVYLSEFNRHTKQIDESEVVAEVYRQINFTEASSGKDKVIYDTKIYFSRKIDFFEAITHPRDADMDHDIYDIGADRIPSEVENTATIEVVAGRNVIRNRYKISVLQDSDGRFYSHYRYTWRNAHSPEDDESICTGESSTKVIFKMQTLGITIVPPKDVLIEVPPVKLLINTPYDNSRCTFNRDKIRFNCENINWPSSTRFRLLWGWNLWVPEQLSADDQSSKCVNIDWEALLN